MTVLVRGRLALRPGSSPWDVTVQMLAGGTIVLAGTVLSLGLLGARAPARGAAGAGRRR